LLLVPVDPSTDPQQDSIPDACRQIYTTRLKPSNTADGDTMSKFTS